MKLKQIIYGLIIIFLSSCSGYTEKDGKIYLKNSNEARIGVNSVEVENADYKTFKEINNDLNIDLALDKNHVFIGASILKYADPNSFEHINEYYWKDKNNIYLLQFGQIDARIQNADPKSFEVFNDYLWTKDKNHVYYEFDILNDVNPKVFIAIDEDWGKDDKFYYYHNLKLDSLDFKTAKIISRDYIKDKNWVFFHNTLVKNANPKTFKADGVGSFGHDDKYMFDWEKNKGLITEEYKKTYIDPK